MERGALWWHSGASPQRSEKTPLPCPSLLPGGDGSPGKANLPLLQNRKETKWGKTS